MERNYQNNGLMFLGRMVFVRVEDYNWRKQFGMRNNKTLFNRRYVILKGIVTDFTDEEIKILLRDNNAFEKDNYEFVFSKGDLLAYGDYSDMEDLGKWMEI